MILQKHCSSAVTGVTYLHVLEQDLIPILQEEVTNDMLFQQHGVPPHFHYDMRVFLYCQFQEN